MKVYIAHLSKVVLVLALVLAVLPVFAGGAGSKNAEAPTKTVDPAIASALAPVDIPQSVFVISGNPRECRNPFFPQAVPLVPLPAPKANSADMNSFVLNGITSPPKRTAMINGSTFEVGEEHEVRVPSGAKVMVKCEDIRTDSAVIIVSGVRHELRLRGGV
jgi:hypothetical protein